MKIPPFVCYHYSQELGPYAVLILKDDWYKENEQKLDEWFKNNCTETPAVILPNVIKFQSYEQYCSFRLSWDE